MEIPTDAAEGDFGEMPPIDDSEQAPPMPMADDEMPTSDEPPMDSSDSFDDEEPMGDVPNEGSEPNDDDDELMNIINGLSIEDKAAVEKYAKSMQDDSRADAPMENEAFRRRFKDVIDETLNSFIDSRNDDERVGDLPKEYKNLSNPFKSPFE